MQGRYLCLTVMTGRENGGQYPGHYMNEYERRAAGDKADTPAGKFIGPLAPCPLTGGRIIPQAATTLRQR